MNVFTRIIPFSRLAVALILVTWGAWTFGASTPFGECIEKRKHYHAYTHIDDGSLYLVRAFLRLELNSACSAHVINHFNGAIAALSGVAVAVFTIVLAFFTFQLGRSSDRIEASSRDTAQRQLRAYVNVLHTRVVTLSGQEQVEIQFKNSGQTPANRCGVEVRVTLSAYPPTGDIIAPLTITDVASRHTLGSGGESSTSVPIIGLNASWIKSIREGTAAVILMGCIDYLDAFQINRRTHFRLACRDVNWDRGIMSHEPAGNDAT